MHVQSCLLNKPIAFLTLSLPSPLPLLKLPKIPVKTWKKMSCKNEAKSSFLKPGTSYLNVSRHNCARA